MVDVVDHPSSGQWGKGDTHLSLINPPLSTYPSALYLCSCTFLQLYFTFVCTYLLLHSTLAFHNSCALVYDSGIYSLDLHLCPLNVINALGITEHKKIPTITPINNSSSKIIGIDSIHSELHGSDCASSRG